MSGWRGSCVIQSGKSAGESFGVEGLEVLSTLADANEVDRETVRLCDRHQNAALRRSVQLRHDQTGHCRRMAKGIDLTERVLPNRRVQNQ
jgi:hypothetical protein